MLSWFTGYVEGGLADDLKGDETPLWYQEWESEFSEGRTEDLHTLPDGEIEGL